MGSMSFRFIFNVLRFSWIIPSQSLLSVHKSMTIRETCRVQSPVIAPSSLLSVSLKAAFVESFELQNWGLFEHSVLNLGSTPLFAVITGETGSGKSVLISALQFLYSGSGSPQRRKMAKGKSDYFLSNTFSSDFSDDPKRSTVTMRKGQDKYSKSYDDLNRKTLCDFNGKKTTIKSIAEVLKDGVRFWSSESLNLLVSGPDGFVKYIDKNLNYHGESKLHNLAETYAEWIMSYDALDELRDLRKRKEDSDEVEVIHQNLKELTVFDGRVEKCLGEAFSLLSEVSELFTSASEREREREGSSVSGAESLNNVSVVRSACSLGALLDEISSCAAAVMRKKRGRGAVSYPVGGGGVPSSTGDISDDGEESVSSRQSSKSTRTGTSVSVECDSWTVILNTLDFLSRMSDALQNAFFENVEAPSSSDSRNRIKENSNSKTDLDISAVSDIIGVYEKRVLNLQKELVKLNIPSTAFDAKMESLHELFGSIEASVARVKKEMTDISSDLPMSRCHEMVSRIRTLKVECEKICRRHSVSAYRDLQSESAKWRTDRDLMESLDFTLPDAEHKERRLKETYIRSALSLTEERITAADSFARRTNNILPRLEMADKMVGVRFDMASLIDGGMDGEQSESSLTTEHLLHQWRRLVLKGDSLTGISSDSDPLEHIRTELVKSISCHVVPGGGVTARGWDDVSLFVRPSIDKTYVTDEASIEHRGFSVRIVVSNAARLEASGLGGAERDVADDSDDDDVGVEVDVLSSGERTRLALAMETCTLTATESKPLSDPSEAGSDSDVEKSPSPSLLGDGLADTSDDKGAPSMLNGKSLESLLVLDEIDAHIGGDAAVAVARLLKEQGRWRQVVLITHNPMVASKADRHYVVAKTIDTSADRLEKKNSDTSAKAYPYGAGGRGVGARSTLSEVTGVAREREISRMVTGGGVHSAAGLALAKALLSTSPKEYAV